MPKPWKNNYGGNNINVFNVASADSFRLTSTMLRSLTNLPAWCWSQLDLNNQNSWVLEVDKFKIVRGSYSWWPLGTLARWISLFISCTLLPEYHFSWHESLMECFGMSGIRAVVTFWSALTISNPTCNLYLTKSLFRKSFNTISKNENIQQCWNNHVWNHTRRVSTIFG